MPSSTETLAPAVHRPNWEIVRLDACVALVAGLSWWLIAWAVPHSWEILVHWYGICATGAPVYGLIRELTDRWTVPIVTPWVALVKTYPVAFIAVTGLLLMWYHADKDRDAQREAVYSICTEVLDVDFEQDERGADPLFSKSVHELCDDAGVY